MERCTNRSFSRAINYTREANLSESIIIAPRQNYVLTPHPPLFARVDKGVGAVFRAVINYGNSIVLSLFTLVGKHYTV